MIIIQPECLTPPPLPPLASSLKKVPHPDWYDAHGSWDGSMSFPNEWNGITEPIAVYDAHTHTHTHTHPTHTLYHTHTLPHTHSLA